MADYIHPACAGGLKPIFIIGSYRSGTSVFAWCLGQHPNILNLPETNWIYQSALDIERLYELGTCNGKHSHIGQTGISKSRFYELIGDGVDNIIHKTAGLLSGYTLDSDSSSAGLRRRRSQDEPKSRWVDATPENSHYVYGLSRMFPSSRFIHIVRDPDDVVRSLAKFSNAGGRDYDQKEGYRTWLRLTDAAFEAERAFGSKRIKRVMYSDLIDRSEQTLRGCLDFLDEDYHVNCLDPLQRRINSSGDEKPAKKLTVKISPAIRSLTKQARALFVQLAQTAGDELEADDEVMKLLERKHMKASRA